MTPPIPTSEAKQTTWFHVHRSGNLIEGQTLDLIPWSCLPEKDRIASPGLQDHVEALFPDGLTRHGQSYFFWQRTDMFPRHPGLYPPQGLNDMRSHAIEILFENIRLGAFSHLPSRFQSVFAWDSLAHAQQFRAQLGSPASIFELHGVATFVGDMNLLGMGTAVESSLAAYRYWRGEAHPIKPPSWEYFLAPGAVVGACVSD